MSFLSILALIFVTLKLIGFITWSWWLVLMPLYLIPILWIFAAFALITFITPQSKKRRPF